MKKLIQSEIERYESYLEQPEKYCEEEDDKGFYTGVVRALKWILFLEDKHCGSKLSSEKWRKMGDRYLISGVQLGSLLVLEQEGRQKIIDEIIEKQYVGDTKNSVVIDAKRLHL